MDFPWQRTVSLQEGNIQTGTPWKINMEPTNPGVGLGLTWNPGLDVFLAPLRFLRHHDTLIVARGGVGGVGPKSFKKGGTLQTGWTKSLKMRGVTFDKAQTRLIPPGSLTVRP